MTPTKTRHMATFLLEMALDQERVKQRIAARLKSWRDGTRMNQADAARHVGLSYRQYQRLEKAQSTARWRTIEMLAERLEINVGDLIGEDEGPEEAFARAQPLDQDDERFDRLFAEMKQLLAGQSELQAEQVRIGKRLERLAGKQRHRASAQGASPDADS